MEQERDYDVERVMAVVRNVREQNAQLYSEIDVLRGELQESRRMCKRLRREWAEAQKKAGRDIAFWRHLLAASVGLAVALTCLLHSIIIAAAI